eukprot:7385121-Prymnesium_polylepis.2
MPDRSRGHACGLPPHPSLEAPTIAYCLSILRRDLLQYGRSVGGCEDGAAATRRGGNRRQDCAVHRLATAAAAEEAGDCGVQTVRHGGHRCHSSAANVYSGPPNGVSSAQSICQSAPPHGRRQ